MLAIRGATTISKDNQESVQKAVVELIKEIWSSNGIDKSEIISINFSSTADIKSYYPAKAFRDLGYDRIPLFSSVEPEIEGSLDHTIRLLVYLERPNSRDVKHVYLNEAANLRPDLID
ncbi:MAG: chorismate mutase [Halarsenatibacteraceae bacterium]